MCVRTIMNRVNSVNKNKQGCRVFPFHAKHKNHLVLLYSKFFTSVSGQGDLQRQFGAIAILLSWINMMMYFRHFFYGML